MFARNTYHKRLLRLIDLQVARAQPLDAEGASSDRAGAKRRLSLPRPINAAKAMTRRLRRGKSRESP